jgi:aspartate/ornithine carbamoyltransferase-like protein
MAFNLRNRSFLKEIDFDPRELRYLLKLAEALKLAKYAGTEVKRLQGKEIALIFEKTSTRTRSAFEVAAYDQGAHVTYLDPSGSLPARVPRPEHHRRTRDHGAHRHDQRPGGDRRGLRLARQHRLRPGREPPAHHQGRPRRHPRRLNRR